MKFRDWIAATIAAILVAAGFSVTGNTTLANAASVDRAFKSATVSPTQINQGDSVTLTFDWAVPVGTSPGDSFWVRIPSSLASMAVSQDGAALRCSFSAQTLNCVWSGPAKSGIVTLKATASASAPYGDTGTLYFPLSGGGSLLSNEVAWVAAAPTPTPTPTTTLEYRVVTYYASSLDQARRVRRLDNDGRLYPAEERGIRKKIVQIVVITVPVNATDNQIMEAINRVSSRLDVVSTRHVESAVKRKTKVTLAWRIGDGGYDSFAYSSKVRRI